MAQVFSESRTVMRLTPTTHVLPIRWATMAACEVAPPLAVRTPSATEISCMSSGTVSERIRMTGLPAHSFLMRWMDSRSKAARPEIAPPLTPIPLPRYLEWRSSVFLKTG